MSHQGEARPAKEQPSWVDRWERNPRMASEGTQPVRIALSEICRLAPGRCDLGGRPKPGGLKLVSQVACVTHASCSAESCSAYLRFRSHWSSVTARSNSWRSR